MAMAREVATGPRVDDQRDGGASGGMSYGTLLLVLVCGMVLAFPAAICVCALLGYLLTKHHRRTTPCPSCRAFALRYVDGIRETYPTGRGAVLSLTQGLQVAENALLRTFDWRYSSRRHLLYGLRAK
jgi:hypothetical protein